MSTTKAKNTKTTTPATKLKKFPHFDPLDGDLLFKYIGPGRHDYISAIVIETRAEGFLVVMDNNKESGAVTTDLSIDTPDAFVIRREEYSSSEPGKWMPGGDGHQQFRDKGIITQEVKLRVIKTEERRNTARFSLPFYTEEEGGARRDQVNTETTTAAAGKPKVVCVHCTKPLLQHPTSSAIYYGFFDQDTKQVVCFNCQDKHYRTKKEKTYSEVPIIFQPEEERGKPSEWTFDLDHDRVVELPAEPPFLWNKHGVCMNPETIFAYSDKKSGAVIRLAQDDETGNWYNGYERKTKTGGGGSSPVSKGKYSTAFKTRSEAIVDCCNGFIERFESKDNAYKKLLLAVQKLQAEHKAAADTKTPTVPAEKSKTTTGTNPTPPTVEEERAMIKAPITNFEIARFSKPLKQGTCSLCRSKDGTCPRCKMVINALNYDAWQNGSIKEAKEKKTSTKKQPKEKAPASIVRAPDYEAPAKGSILCLVCNTHVDKAYVPCGFPMRAGICTNCSAQYHTSLTVTQVWFDGSCFCCGKDKPKVRGVKGTKIYDGICTECVEIAFNALHPNIAPPAEVTMPLPTLEINHAWEALDISPLFTGELEALNPLTGTEILEENSAVVLMQPESTALQAIRSVNYPGSKHSPGVYHKIINQVPRHDVFISGFLGTDAVLSHIAPAGSSIGIDVNLDALKDYWNNCRKDVKLVKDDFLSWVQQFNFSKQMGQRWFIYLDPPYKFSSRRSGAILYDHELTDSDHDRLIQWAIDTTSLSDVKIAISHYPCPEYDELLNHGFRKITYKVATRQEVVDECLYMNYPEPTELHDYRFYGEDKIKRQAYKRKVAGYIEKFSDLPDVERTGILRALATQFNVSTPPQVY